MKRPTYVKADKALKQFIKSALEEDIQSGDHSHFLPFPKIWYKVQTFGKKKIVS